MSHQQIIQTLIEWIDEHIDQPLNIDVVAKIGLLKWYLQRMFRTVTHQTLGEYIRQRRLLLAAVELRTTERPILISRWTGLCIAANLLACIPPRVRSHSQRLPSPPVGRLPAYRQRRGRLL